MAMEMLVGLNVIDDDEYPTLYLIDKSGKLRVANPHILGLESAIAELLAEF